LKGVPRLGHANAVATDKRCVLNKSKNFYVIRNCVGRERQCRYQAYDKKLYDSEMS